MVSTGYFTLWYDDYMTSSLQPVFLLLKRVNYTQNQTKTPLRTDLRNIYGRIEILISPLITIIISMIYIQDLVLVFFLEMGTHL